MGVRYTEACYMKPKPTMKAADGKQATDLMPSTDYPPPSRPLGYDKVTSYEKYLA